VTGCFSWILAIGGLVLGIVSIIRWFEQVTEAVDRGWWNKTLVLVMAPPVVWLYPSRVSAGRPVPVPLHSPVMGMGSAPKAKGEAVADRPPPGTPKEFLEPPRIPPKKPPLTKRAPVDADKIAKLKQKMREQGMLDDETRS
jgi:hypothetical protein